jgi:plastocyanin
MRKRVCSAAIVAGLAFGAFGAVTFARSGGHSGKTAQEKSATEVKIDNFSFSPATVTVPAGTSVTWVNRDDIPHTVVSTDDPRVFKSKVLDTDEKFSFTFDKPGTYSYFCSVHPKMTGKVVVQ